MTERETNLAAGAAGAHPDPDVLTAFAEGSLSTREREGVLRHLGGCAYCREVVGVAAEAAEPQPAPVAVMPPRRATWGVLAGLATAAVLLLVSGLVIRQQLRQVTNPPAVAQNTAPAAPPPQTVPAEAQHAPVARPEKKALEKRTRPAPETPRVMAEAVPPAALLESSRTAAVENTQRSALAPQLEAGRGIASSARMKEPSVVASSQMAAAPPAPIGGPQRLQAKPSPAPTTATAYVNADTVSVFTNEPALELTRPRWRINAQGKPERAIGRGKWQPVPLLQAGRMHAIATIGSEVWMGGENAELFRSADNGETWTPVTLPEKGSGTHTIAHIRAGVAGEITVVAKDGTAWTSEDGGATWK